MLETELFQTGRAKLAMCASAGQFDKFAGQNVTIKGKLDGKTITVNSIAAAKF
jgi:hypothetical protein